MEISNIKREIMSKEANLRFTTDISLEPEGCMGYSGKKSMK